MASPKSLGHSGTQTNGWFCKLRLKPGCPEPHFNTSTISSTATTAARAMVKRMTADETHRIIAVVVVVALILISGTITYCCVRRHRRQRGQDVERVHVGYEYR